MGTIEQISDFAGQRQVLNPAKGLAIASRHRQSKLD
jgi:hypothetical protein